MNDDQDRYETFMTLHAGELRVKAIAAAGSPCVICTEPMELSAPLPWLMCKNNHRTRPWTETEIEAMEKRDAL